MRLKSINLVHASNVFLLAREDFCVLEQFTVDEKEDVYLMYGAANSNRREALRFYHQTFPGRKMPDHKLFLYLHRQLARTVDFISKDPMRVD